MTAHALIVDDEADLCRLMQMTLTKMGLSSDVAYTLGEAETLFAQKRYDFCLTDLALPDGSGLDLVKTVVAAGKNTPIAIITAHGTIDIAIEALKLGAFDLVNKPLELSRLRELISSALKLIDDNKNTVSASPEDDLLNTRLIGQSPPMMALQTTIKKLAKSQAPVFLSGESGTGKEVVAKLIHDLSPRRDGNFVPVNCGAIPSELMESEFFGHKKGSFTGATADKIGLFQQASGGTLFLDEVADLPLAMQVKLLRAIQEKSIRAVGDTKEIPVDIRLLSATHKDLARLVQSGHFRQDLFYRINVIMVQLPTLNERKADIDALAQHFLALIAQEWGIDAVPALSADALAALKAHSFAGNVRELRNLLERAITMAETPVIEPEHLLLDSPSGLGMSLDATTLDVPVNIGINALQNFATPQYDDQNKNYPFDHPLMDKGFASHGSLTVQAPINQTSANMDNTENNATVQNPARNTGLLAGQCLEDYLQDQEKNLILAALAQSGNNKTKAAKLLGMSFRALRYRMKKMSLDGVENTTSND